MSGVLRLLALLSITVAHAPAQATKAELLGLVRDPAGLPVQLAIVEVIHTGAGVRASVATAKDGSYQFLALTPGDYRLSVAKDNFRILRRSGVTLRVGDRLRLDLNLELGDASQTIEVTAGAPLLNASRGSVGFVVDQRRVVTLPLDGRNFVPLLTLSPGVNLPPGSLLPRINGSRPRVSEYIYDGISVLQPEPGQVAFYPIVDAIAEFRVETNSYSAEYGRSNGGVIMVNQKSGSNSFHGALFEFFRNEKLNARNLFGTSVPRPRFRRNQYGFVVGGPIQKDKTFFFADWQGTRLNTGVIQASTVPTSSQRGGVFPTPVYDPATTRRTATGYLRDAFPENTIPANRFDRAALAVLERYRSPNVFTALRENLTEYAFQATFWTTTISVFRDAIR